MRTLEPMDVYKTQSLSDCHLRKERSRIGNGAAFYSRTSADPDPELQTEPVAVNVGVALLSSSTSVPHLIQALLRFAMFGTEPTLHDRLKLGVVMRCILVIKGHALLIHSLPPQFTLSLYSYESFKTLGLHPI